MPLTPEQIQSFAAQRLGLQEDAERSRRRTQEDYDIQSRLVNEQSARDQTQVADQIASQGLYNSGIRINEQGQVVRRANEAISQYGLNRARGLEDITAGLTRGLAGIDERERASFAEAARRDQEIAIQNAALEAQRRAAIVQPPAYPNPVIPFQMAQPAFDPVAAWFAAMEANKQKSAQSNYASMIGRSPGGVTGSTPLASYLRQHQAVPTSIKTNPQSGYYAHGYSYSGK